MVSPSGANQWKTSGLCAYREWCSLCCDCLSLVYFPPFFLLAPLNDDCVSFSVARDQYHRCSFSPSVNTEFGGGKKDVPERRWPPQHCYVGFWAHTLCVWVCVYFYSAARCVSSLVDMATRPMQLESTFIFPTLTVRRGRDCGVSIRRRQRIKGVSELKIYSHFLNYKKSVALKRYGFQGALAGWLICHLSGEASEVWRERLRRGPAVLPCSNGIVCSLTYWAKIESRNTGTQQHDLVFIYFPSLLFARGMCSICRSAEVKMRPVLPRAQD